MAHSAKGFTLIEMFVAITILALAVVGPLTIASRGLNTTVLARDQLTAAYLAQEGIEYIRYIKDSNVLSGDDWMTGLDDCLKAEGCQVDPWSDTTTIADCSSSTDGCQLLRFNTAPEPTYLYSYGVTVYDIDTSFRRSVFIKPVSLYEKAIVVNMEWQFGSNRQNLEITDRIFNWAQGLGIDQTP